MPRTSQTVVETVSSIIPVSEMFLSLVRLFPCKRYNEFPVNVSVKGHFLFLNIHTVKTVVFFSFHTFVQTRDWMKKLHVSSWVFEPGIELFVSLKSWLFWVKHWREGNEEDRNDFGVNRKLLVRKNPLFIQSAQGMKGREVSSCFTFFSSLFFSLLRSSSLFFSSVTGVSHFHLKRRTRSVDLFFFFSGP